MDMYLKIDIFDNTTGDRVHDSLLTICEEVLVNSVSCILRQ